jgi:hypothetical protein
VSWTKEEILARAADVRADTRRFFDRDGEVQAVTFLFATIDPNGEPGKHFVLVPPTPGMLRSEQGKDAYADALELVASRLEARAVLSIIEVWWVELEEGAPLPAKLTPPSEDPRRIERVLVTLETHDGTTVWVADIKREGDKATLLEWQEHKPTQYHGRFARLLAPVN